MVTSLYEINPVMPDNVNESMFLGNSSRPDARPDKFERFGFANALKRVSHDGFDQLKNTKSSLPVRLYPVP
jgi:hypothetical protein